MSATHPTPGGTQPTVISMDVYRSEPGVTAFRIATGISPTGSFDDYPVGGGVEYTYYVRAVGDSGATADSAEVTS